MSKMVLVGLAAAWFFAASPTRRSDSVKATYEGVIRFPERTIALATGQSHNASQNMLELLLTLVVHEDLDLALLHHTDAAVCGTQILLRVSCARPMRIGSGEIVQCR